MMTATLTSSTRTNPFLPLSKLAKRFVNALVASRIRAAELELRRREALTRDIACRQDHSPQFLNQDDLLPFKI